MPLQLILEFERGLKLAFCDARRFGKIRLQEDPENNEPVSKLGFDPVLEMVDVEEFRQKLAAQRRAIKTVILDQVCIRLELHAELPHDRLFAVPSASMHVHIIPDEDMQRAGSNPGLAHMPSIAHLLIQDLFGQDGPTCCGSSPRSANTLSVRVVLQLQKEPYQ